MLNQLDGSSRQRDHIPEHAETDTRAAIHDLIVSARDELLSIIPASGFESDRAADVRRLFHFLGSTPKSRIILANRPHQGLPTRVRPGSGRRKLRFAQGPASLILLADRRVAVTSGMRNPWSLQAAVITTDPAAVRALHGIFEHTWLNAIELNEEIEVLMNGLRGAILRRLTLGMTNDLVAKELDISSRTVQRHVAETMQLLNARSRLELGFRLAALYGSH